MLLSISAALRAWDAFLWEFTRDEISQKVARCDNVIQCVYNVYTMCIQCVYCVLFIPVLISNKHQKTMSQSVARGIRPGGLGHEAGGCCVDPTALRYASIHCSRSEFMDFRMFEVIFPCSCHGGKRSCS